MPVIPESEWQKKFNKTLSQDNTETWQNKFKKPAWQQDTRTWKEKFTRSIELVYKPINKIYYINQYAVIFIEKATLWAGSFFFKVTIVLKKDGMLSVFVRAQAPIELVPQTTIEWDVIVTIEINDIVFQKKLVENDSKTPILLPIDGFTTIGYVDLKLPRPQSLYEKIFLIIEGGYTIDTGNGLIQPMPRRAERKYQLDVIKQP